MAAHWLISIDCLKTVGGFSPTFPHYGEDDNYLQRAKLYNFKIGVVPNANAIHDRAERQLSKSQRMYLDYKKWLVRISNPLKSKNHYEINILRDTLLKIRKYKSFVPIKYCWYLFKNYNNILKNKQISFKDEGAFIKAKR